MLEAKIAALTNQVSTIERIVALEDPVLSFSLNKIASKQNSNARSKPAPSDLLKAMWKRAAGVCHPDRGGTSDEFNEARKLYEEQDLEGLRLLLTEDPVASVVKWQEKYNALEKSWAEDHKDSRTLVQLWVTHPAKVRQVILAHFKNVIQMHEGATDGS